MGFFLTTGFLGMMYYFVPKQAERPVYSYRLSIVHFWALIPCTSGPARTTCTTPRCRTGRSRWAW
ncbi:cbb3-type cytochrome c oxidase subunit I [Pseudomonas aeruginosa]|uniref:cbb3-type cytochrome c oxidase subunit I n=1 Tax=Pseudomonas aeruginosa TaxID=287 RepID=UPI003F866A83